MTQPWGAEPGDGYDRAYYDPDPDRHDAVGWDEPEPHKCSHPIDDHTYVDGGCAWLGCGCTWFDPASIPPEDPDDFSHVALADLAVEPEPEVAL